MRTRVDVVFEGGKISYEVSAVRSGGDVITIGKSRTGIRDALSLAIANTPTAIDPMDLDLRCALTFLDKLRGALGVGKNPAS